MPRYRVPLYSELYRSVEVEAETEDAAIELAKASDFPEISTPEGVRSLGSWLLDEEPEKLD